MSVLKWIAFTICGIILIKNLNKTFKTYGPNLVVADLHERFRLYFPDKQALRTSNQQMDPHDLMLSWCESTFEEYQSKETREEDYIWLEYDHTDDDVIGKDLIFHTNDDFVVYSFFPEKPYKNNVQILKEIKW